MVSRDQNASSGSPTGNRVRCRSPSCYWSFAICSRCREFLVTMNPHTSALPRFQHVTVTFPPGEEQHLRSFYLDVIGFEEKPVPRVVKPLGWIWFYTGDDGVELHCVPDEAPVPEDSVHHFCIQVADLEGCRARLAQAD